MAAHPASSVTMSRVDPGKVCKGQPAKVGPNKGSIVVAGCGRTLMMSAYAKYKRAICDECANKSRRKDITVSDISAGLLSSPARSVEDAPGLTKSEEHKAGKVAAEKALHLSTFLPFLAQRRYTDEYSWVDIGRAIHKAYNGSEKGLELWMSETEDSKTERKGSECKARYDTFDSLALPPVTIKTIAFYARIDNVEMYDKWHNVYSLKKVAFALSSKVVDVSKLFYAIYWLEYMWSGSSWYYFDREKHRLVEDKNGEIIYLMITRDFRDKLDEWRVNVEGSEAADKREADQLENSVKAFKSLSGRLATPHYVKQVVIDLRDLFKVDGMTEYIDSNVNLTGVANGVLEATENAIFPRNGKPEDYIIKFAPTYYDEKMTVTSPTVVKLCSWLEQMYPDTELLRFILKRDSGMLCGRNLFRKIYLEMGPTGSNKSTKAKLISNTFGGYTAAAAEGELDVTNSSNSEGPSPAASRLSGARCHQLGELKSSNILDAAKIKSASGGDAKFTRRLNENGSTKKNTVALIVGNYNTTLPPKISNVDEAIMERIVVVPYTSRWVLGDLPSVPGRHQVFKVDIDFEDKILPTLSSAYLWLLVRYYPALRREEFVIPTACKEATAKYFATADTFSSFISQAIEKCPNYELSTLVAHDNYKTWFNRMNTNARIKPADRETFIMEMSSIHRLGELSPSRCWVGFGVKAEHMRDPFRGPPYVGKAPFFGGPPYVGKASCSGDAKAHTSLTGAGSGRRDNLPPTVEHRNDIYIHPEESDVPTWTYLFKVEGKLWRYHDKGQLGNYYPFLCICRSIDKIVPKTVEIKDISYLYFYFVIIKRSWEHLSTNQSEEELKELNKALSLQAHMEKRHQ